MEVDLEELVAIIELLDKTEFTQFRFEKGDLRIAVSRGEALAAEGAASAPAAQASVAPAQPAPAPVVPAAAAPTPAPAQTAATAPSATSAPQLADGDVIVRAPMLGTFYRSPKPGEPPFVEIGASVAADSVLCIIEVMKLMNSVTAGAAGVVKQVLASDGELIEFDQPLYVIGQA